MPRLLRRLSALLHPDRDRELAEEMRFHQEQLEADGATPAQAARAFGNDILLRQRARDQWGWLWLAQLAQDLRHAARQARRSPAATATAVLILALGIGVGTAVFTVFDAVLLRPLPYSQPQRLVKVEGETGLQRVAGPGLRLRRAAWISDIRTLTDWVSDTIGQVTIGADGDHLAQRADAAEVSTGLFHLLGVHPLGRDFVPGDNAPGHDHIAILRSDLAARWGGPAGMIGHTLRLDGTDYRVVGVVPRWVDIPYATQIWMPMPRVWNMDTDPLANSVIVFESLARLRPGATPAQARADVLRAQAPPANIRADIERDLTIVPLQQSQTSDTAPVLWMLLGAVGLVLLIACANVASLQLTQALRRQHETAVRIALGASRGRIARQHLAEALALALLGGGLGVAVACASFAALRAALPAGLVLATPLALDHRVLLFALAVALGSALAIGMAPALSAGHRPQVRLQTAGGGGPIGAQRLRAMLVVAEVALATVLLAGAGLLLASLGRLSRVNPGIQPAGLLTAQFNLGGPADRTSADRVRFYRSLEGRLAALPGVTASALGTNLPLHTGATFTLALHSLGNSTGSYFTSMSPGYFQALGIPLLAGRGFTASDQKGSTPVAVVSRSLAAALWPGLDPVGRLLKIPSEPGTKKSVTIVGMVADTHLQLDQSVAHNLYFPLAQRNSVVLTLILRTPADPESLAAPLRRALAGLDPDLALSRVSTIPAIIRADTADQRFRSWLLSLFAALALGLSACGLGAVLAHSAALRTREIGVRMALGARPRQAAGLILAQGLRLAAIGLVIGVGAALAVNRLLASFLFGIAPDNLGVLAIAAALLAAASLLACWLPARRATRVDPMIALRCE